VFYSLWPTDDAADRSTIVGLTVGPAGTSRRRKLWLGREPRMRDLNSFRAAVRVHRRAVGRTQQQLARAIGLHPSVLSHKLNGTDSALLTTPEVIGIVSVLARWGALVARADAEALLELMAVPRHAVPATAWGTPPLASLHSDAHPTRHIITPPPPAANAPDSVSTADQNPAHRLTVAPLPTAATQLIGRTAERAAVAAVLGTARLVTLTGVGGTGKTRLALQLGHDLIGRYADGVGFIDLAAVDDPSLVATAVSRALGLAPPSAAAAEAHLIEALRRRELLLILDNLEQLLAEAALLARLLAAAPALRLLVTSRVPLRLYGEHTFRVPPLHTSAHNSPTAEPDSEAEQLFLARAHAARPTFAPALDDFAAIAAICRSLDGLPLAIELAAARIRLYSPQDLLPLLRSRLTLLRGGPRDVPDRQQTLRGALDWSYQLLPWTAKNVFSCLGVFRGQFDAAAAAAVSDEPDDAATLEVLVELADQSMLEVAPSDGPRFSLLQTVGEYALARLAESGQQDEVQERHLNHYLTKAMTAPAAIDSSAPTRVDVQDALEGDYTNIRAALEFACSHAEHGSYLNNGLKLAAAMRQVWARRGPLAEGLFLLTRLLAADDVMRAADPKIRCDADLAACHLACFSGDYPATAQYGRHAIELYASLDDQQGLARVHRFIGEALYEEGDFVAAEPHFEHAITAAQRAGDPHAQAQARHMLAQLQRHQSRLSSARANLRHAIRLFELADTPDDVAAAMHNLGEVERDAGDLTAARHLFISALRSDVASGNKFDIAYVLEGFATLTCLEENGDQAVLYLGAAQALRHEIGSHVAPVVQAELSRIISPATTGLSPPAYDAALRQARNRPLGEIVASILE
jgi:predicted ATPase